MGQILKITALLLITPSLLWASGTDHFSNFNDKICYLVEAHSKSRAELRNTGKSVQKEFGESICAIADSIENPRIKKRVQDSLDKLAGKYCQGTKFPVKNMDYLDDAISVIRAIPPILYISESDLADADLLELFGKELVLQHYLLPLEKTGEANPSLKIYIQQMSRLCD